MNENVSIQSSGLMHQMKEMYRAHDTPRVRNELYEKINQRKLLYKNPLAGLLNSKRLSFV